MEAESAEQEGLDYSWPFGKAHKRSRRIIGAALLLLIISISVFFLFNGELRAFAWHLRHGNTYAYSDVVFPVQRSEFVECPIRSLCLLVQGQGILRQRLFRLPPRWILIRTDSRKYDQRELNAKRAAVLKWSLVRESEVDMAGYPMQCQEYSLGPDRFHTVNCFSKATPILVNFTGLPGDVPAFHQFLSSSVRKK